jgi:hypothetical protein
VFSQSGDVRATELAFAPDEGNKIQIEIRNLNHFLILSAATIHQMHY